MLYLLFLVLLPASALGTEMSLNDFLRAAWEKSPVLAGEKLQNAASEELVSSARGKYLPHVSVDAIDSTGFPASNSGLGVEGLAASPFRSGAAGDIVVEQTVYDFGRISAALQRSKAEKSLAQARLAADKFQFLNQMGQLYLTCARTISLEKADQELLSWAQINLKETARYTRTGQRSIIDNSLVQTEVSVLKLALDQLRKFRHSLIQQMKMFGGQGCRSLSDSWQVPIPENLRVEDPAVLLAKAQMEVSSAGVEEAKSAQLPSIKAMGSAGEMDDARLVDKQNYAAGVGVEFPIWNGAEDARREQAYKIQTDYQKENLKAAELEFAAGLTNLRDRFARHREALSTINTDLRLVQKSMKLATQRYRTLQGPLIDVREAFKQLREMQAERLRVLYTLGGDSLQLNILRAHE